MARTMRRQNLSMRGSVVDFEALALQNAKTPVLGNTRTNVRGDILGDNATILKTQEQVEAEWAAKRALQEKINQQTSIKADQMGPAASKRAAANPSVAADVSFPTVQDLVKDGTIPVSATPKRKIVDSE